MPRTRLVFAALALVLATAVPATAATPKRLRLGALTLRPCGDVKGWWCGSLPRPLDPARPRGEHIGIDFRWRPPTAGKARGPALVAVEGGPGYPSTGSRVEYVGIYGPLLRERGLLLVDNRGTGTSGLIDCKPLQGFTGRTSGSGFPRIVAACARQIQREHPRTPGAADLFATAYAADDLAAVLRALRLGRVDLYGDSYGTWFAQSFMSRHQDLLHSVVLDSAYPVRDLDPWYASSGEIARQAMDLVCVRHPGCAPFGGGAAGRLDALVAKLRTAPITGPTRDADGSKVARARADVRAVVDMVQDAASDPIVYRELDASVRAALAGDDVPLLRLVAQSQTWSHGTSTPDYFSDGLYMAVACTDYPQLFSMSSPPAQRRTELAASIATGPPFGSFSPFTVPEWLSLSAYSEPYRACLDWPVPTHTAPVVSPTSAPLPASIPLLVVGGDLDSLTPLVDAKLFAPKLGADVRVVTLANTVHVTSEGDTMLSVGASCGRRIIREFVRAPAKAPDTACAARIPPLHVPGAFPRRFGDTVPATLLSGDDPGETARRAAAVAAQALADATIRRVYSGVATGPGLRGGTFRVSGSDPLRLRLHGIRFVGDATVDGEGTWRLADGRIRGTLVVRPPSGSPVKVRLAWSQADTLAEARTGGAVLELPAP